MPASHLPQEAGYTGLDSCENDSRTQLRITGDRQSYEELRAAVEDESIV